MILTDNTINYHSANIDELSGELIMCCSSDIDKRDICTIKKILKIIETKQGVGTPVLNQMQGPEPFWIFSVTISYVVTLKIQFGSGPCSNLIKKINSLLEFQPLEKFIKIPTKHFLNWIFELTFCSFNQHDKHQ